MLHSHYRPLCAVTLPYAARQVYMAPINLEAVALPDDIADYNDVVTALCGAAGAHAGRAFVTIDERIVNKGESQRRPGPHVDGCFIPEIMDWGHGGGGGWKHVCNAAAPGGEVGKFARMPVIVAASVLGCRAWPGEFDAEPMPDGDLSHISSQLLDFHTFSPNKGYLLSPDCVHESMAVSDDTERTFLRIALPTDFEVTQ